MEDGEENLEIYELQFHDLMLLSSDEPSSSLPLEEIERLESITRKIMENLGPTGPGLLAITGVPNASTLRRTLLPLARKISLLSTDDRKRILKEHGLGSDVPLKNLNRTVSSFAMQLKYMQGVEVVCGEASSLNPEKDYPDAERLVESPYSEFGNLRSTFKELGICMMELGCRLARICDRFIGGQELVQSLLESCTAKGRLIHYHSTLDNLVLKEAAKRRGSNEGRSNCKGYHKGSNGTDQFRNEWTSSGGYETKSTGAQSNLWQQWHYDYGIFTVLTSPLFMLPCHPQPTTANNFSCVACEECHPPSGHTYLQIYYPNRTNVLTVKASPESFIVQVGESADILSKGKLRSTLHSVSRPKKYENLSRETFVVFLQPAWCKTFSLTDYPIEHLTQSSQPSDECTEECQDIHKVVPPLSKRLKDGMTFAEFSKVTTKQYYGGSGLQSKR